jgi:glycosyltransferase involved in cell wall biosynthesis
VNSAPELTIVVPTRGRPAQLRNCLEGISRQEVEAHRFEVVIVDDGTPGSLAPLIECYRERLALRLIVQPRSMGPAAARNAGVEIARGRFLAFIDDDCVSSPHWLTALMRELRSQPNCLLGGYVENGLPDNSYSAASQQINTYVRRYYEGGHANEMFFPTNNIALSAERFRELGGFNTLIPSHTAEDKEFCDRWRSRNYQMAYVPDAVVCHSHDLSCWQFLRQHFSYGRGILVFRQIRRRRRPGSLIPERFGFYWNLILHPLRAKRDAAAWQQAGLMVIAQLATAAGAIWAALRENSDSSKQQRPPDRTTEPPAAPRPAIG